MLLCHLDLAACHLRSFAVADTLPAVISSLFMNDMRPINIVETDQAGLKLFGWKSEILRHNLVLVWKRPLGVCMRMAGGAKG